MTLKVIGAGFPRTGTNSFKLAMEMLGFDRCHHMYEVLANPQQAPDFLAAALGEPVDWDAVYTGYQACCDFPSCYFWRELSEYYPDAKIVLTTRSAEGWYESMRTTIFDIFEKVGPGMDNPISSMGREILYKRMFGENFEDRAHVIDVFERHNQRILDSIPPERLLVFEARQGWAPLCEFLGVAVPDQPYPNANALDEFWQKTQGFIDQMEQ